MVREFEKGEDRRLSSHFFVTDFDCRCVDPSCRITYVDTDLVASLEQLKSVIDFEITNGFRCANHNKAIGGKPGSQHLQGKAADLKSEMLPEQLAKVCEGIMQFAKGGIGAYSWGVHVDVRGYRSRW